MAYSNARSGTVSVTKTPSMLYGNLSCNGATCAFAHRGEVLLRQPQPLRDVEAHDGDVGA